VQPEGVMIRGKRHRRDSCSVPGVHASMVTRRIGIGAVAALLLRGAAAEAADLSHCDPGTAERIQFIEDRLELRRPYATLWWHGWTGSARHLSS